MGPPRPTWKALGRVLAKLRRERGGVVSLRRLSASFALATLATLATAVAPPSAHAQVCLDCFTETLGTNPFAAPLVLPHEYLLTGTLGLAGPFNSPTWLPNLLAKYGLRDGLELEGTLGYEPAFGARVFAWSQGPVTLLGSARVGYSYFRGEWLGRVSVPVLWAPGSGWSLRAEPQLTVNQVTGNHLAMDLTLARLLTTDTSIALTVAPDYRLAEQLWTGSAAVALSRSFSPRWAAYVLGSVYVINQPTPLVAIGVTYLPPPRE
jgi:hypothetical protein